MATSHELKNLAIGRLDEAELLYQHEHFEGAYYLGGYAIEFALKAVICKKLDIEMFDKPVVPGNLLKAFLIHDLYNLAILGGLKNELETMIKTDGIFAQNWSIVSEWSEQRRYDSGCNSQTVRKFLNSVKNILQWIKHSW